MQDLWLLLLVFGENPIVFFVEENFMGEGVRERHGRKLTEAPSVTQGEQKKPA
jgi:hypothetical protein